LWGTKLIYHHEISKLLGQFYLFQIHSLKGSGSKVGRLFSGTICGSSKCSYPQLKYPGSLTILVPKGQGIGVVGRGYLVTWDG